MAGVWRGRPCARGDAGRFSRRPAVRVVPWGWAWAGARVSTCRAAPLSGPGAGSRRGARGSSGGVTLQGDLYGRTLYRGDLYGGRRGRIGPRWGLAPHRSALWRPVAPRPKVRFGAPPFSFLLPGPQTSLGRAEKREHSPSREHRENVSYRLGKWEYDHGLGLGFRFPVSPIHFTCETASFLRYAALTK